MKKLSKIFVVLTLALSPVFLNAIESDSLRTMRYEDIVNIERPKIVSISPDGSKIAYVIQKAFIDKNCNKNILYLWHANNHSQKWLLDLDKINQLTWSGNNSLYLLGQDANAYKIILISESGITPLVDSSNPISAVAISSDGKHLYYAQSIKTPKEIVQKNKEEGYVYRWGLDTSLTVIEKNYEHKEYAEVLHQAIDSGTTSLVTKFAHGNIYDWMDLVSNLALSENNRYLAVVAERMGNPVLRETPFTTDLIVWDTYQTKAQTLLKDSPKFKVNPCWINDKELVFQEIGDKKNFFWLWNCETDAYTLLDFIPSNKWSQTITWDKQNSLLLIESSKKFLQVSLQNKSTEEIELPTDFFRLGIFSASFSYDDQLKFIACIKENHSAPPQLILYDREKKQATEITNLNSFLKHINLGHIEDLTVEIENGISSKGYLIHPVNEIPNKKYPLIIATYDFTGQTFIADAEWHSSFPAQTLAAEGYAVLLLNNCQGSQCTIGDSEKAREIEGWRSLAIFEQAVDMLDKRGLIDAEKVGLYGWSNGGFTVEFLISHSDKFHVACIGEGGDFNPGGFWAFGVPTWPNIYYNVFGGPPFGNTLKNYFDYSPFFNVEKIKTPLLMEFSEAAIASFEMYVPLRYLNKPAELVIYDGEEHNFEKPKARMASMARKVDWFNYWLLNKKSNFSQPEQYNRWDEMHSKMQVND